MHKRIANEPVYPFTWLDELAEITLNPEKSLTRDLPFEELQDIQQKLPGEFVRINDSLKRQAFSLYRNDYIKVVAGHYDQAIRLLKQQMLVNLSLYPETGILRDTGQILLDNLNDLYQHVHQRYDGYLTPLTSDRPDGHTPFKVTCRLSVDQIAIILKAADNLQIVVARSFSQVLRSIVPFLSTERFTDFSWKSARSSTYKMEDSDREVVIRMLEELIRKIRDL